MAKAGKNIDLSVSGKTLTIKVDLSKSHGTSKSGNSEIIATSSGNIDIPGASGVKLGLNIYKPV